MSSCFEKNGISLLAQLPKLTSTDLNCIFRFGSSFGVWSGGMTTHKNFQDEQPI